jgi:hypothetical protein
MNVICTQCGKAIVGEAASVLLDDFRRQHTDRHGYASFTVVRVDDEK